MRVSILVGAHNEGERLWRTVESILETVGRLDAELIVGDDGSTDGSIQELGRHFPQVLVVKQKKRLGVGAARGLAAGRARGDVLIFLDGHTKPEPGALERLVASVEKTRGKAVVTPQIVGLDETTWRSQPQQIGNGYALDLETFDSWWLPLKKMKEVKEGRQTFYESPALIGCALAVSRELYDRLWGFDQHMRQWGSEDVDFALKAWTMGARVLHDPGATVAHRFQRYFGDYEVSAEYPLANQIRTARKHFTQSVWEDWLVRAQEQQRRRLKDHPEGLWASAWEVFQRDRQSAEHERAYLLSRRPQDEFWYAKRFDRSWPTMGGAASLLAQPALPPHVLFARPEASPAPVLISIDPDQGGQGQTVPVTLSGSNFDGVTINAPSGVTPSISSQDATTIDGTFDISATAPLNTRGTVSVTNASGLQSNTVTFAILVTPSITSISPNNGVQGATVPITLTGTGLQSPTFNSIPGITVTNQDNVSNTEITADFVIASNATTGVVQVSVTNEGGGITSNSVGFTINPAASPVITEIDPPQGALIGTTVALTIGGTNFNNATVNVPSGFTFTPTGTQTDTEIDGRLMIPSSVSGGNISISVTNQGGAKSNGWNFFIQIPTDLDIVFQPTQQVKDGNITDPFGKVLATNADGAYQNWTASLYDQNDPAGVIYAAFTFTEKFKNYASTISGSSEPTTKSVDANTAVQPLGDTQAVFKQYPNQVGKGVMKYTQYFTVTVGSNVYSLATSISWTFTSPGGGGTITIVGDDG
jgi:GT2 family glycosyltransferase